MHHDTLWEASRCYPCESPSAIEAQHCKLMGRYAALTTRCGSPAMCQLLCYWKKALDRCIPRVTASTLIKMGFCIFLFTFSTRFWFGLILVISSTLFLIMPRKTLANISNLIKSTLNQKQNMHILDVYW